MRNYSSKCTVWKKSADLSWFSSVLIFADFSFFNADILHFQPGSTDQCINSLRNLNAPAVLLMHYEVVTHNLRMDANRETVALAFAKNLAQLSSVDAKNVLKPLESILNRKYRFTIEVSLNISSIVFTWANRLLLPCALSKNMFRYLVAFLPGKFFFDWEAGTRVKFYRWCREILKNFYWQACYTLFVNNHKKRTSNKTATEHE